MKKKSLSDLLPLVDDSDKTLVQSWIDKELRNDVKAQMKLEKLQWGELITALFKLYLQERKNNLK